MSTKYLITLAINYAIFHQLALPSDSFYLHHYLDSLDTDEILEYHTQNTLLILN